MSEQPSGGAGPPATRSGIRLVPCTAGALVSLTIAVSAGAVVTALLSSAGGTPSGVPDPIRLGGLIPIVLLLASFVGGVVAGYGAGTRAPDQGIATWALTGVAGVALILIIGLIDPDLGRLGRIPMPSFAHDVVLIEVVAVLGLILSLAGSIAGAASGIALARRPIVTSPSGAPPQSGQRSGRRR